ncbi:hypothetical protein RRG08_044633 [Elysia crispata]|uniref:Uncharacterized protein n=1 Tax=Elysia crispata TaxID=231223 RepID=A0AAE1D172_9GAST|nr:hypothetical protein RRG08_044633 [Elysia crispata]
MVGWNLTPPLKLKPGFYRESSRSWSNLLVNVSSAQAINWEHIESTNPSSSIFCIATPRQVLIDGVVRQRRWSDAGDSRRRYPGLQDSLFDPDGVSWNDLVILRSLGKKD